MRFRFLLINLVYFPFKNCTFYLAVHRKHQSYGRTQRGGPWPFLKSLGENMFFIIGKIKIVSIKEDWKNENKKRKKKEKERISITFLREC